MSKLKKWITAGVVIIIILLAALITSRYMKPKTAQVADALPVVSVVNPEARTIELNTELIGTIEQDNMIYVTPKGSGELTSVNIKTGDMVSAGQVLCVIDTKQVESARIALETARISKEQAESSLARLAPLHAAGAVSDQDYQQAEDGVKMSRLQYENAQIGYNIQVENSQVTAPIAGRIESSALEVHDMVSPQTQICVIAGDGGKAVTFYASDRVVSGLEVGDELRIEKNGSDYQAAITEVSSIIDTATGLFKVKAAIQDGAALAVGSSVKLYLVSDKAENVLTVPIDTVYHEGGKPFIYTYGDGEVHKNEVETGLGDSEYIEIRSGLNASDQVIASWTSELYDGSKVTLAGQTEETAAASSAAAE